MPEASNPQALNRYSYVYNNPLTFIDPTGHWPNWGKIWGGIKSVASAIASDPLGALQTALDIAGMIPGIGEAFDAVNGIIYAARGDVVNAALSFASCIPVVGNVVGGARIAAKVVDKVHDTVRLVDRAGDVADGLRSFTKSNFRENLRRVTGRTIESIKGFEAHHMLPQKFIDFFKGKGLDIHDPIFGVMLEKTKHSKWSYAFNKDWEEWIVRYGNDARMEDVLAKARQLAEKYGIPESDLLWLNP